LRTELVNTLLKAGIINEEAVLEAMEHNMGSSLVERLLDLGYGSEQDVYKIIKNKLKLEVVGPDDIANIDPRVFKIVPRGLVERHHILPFYADSTNIHVAVIDPTQDSCMNELCFFSHLRVMPYGILASDLTKALNKYYQLGLPEEFRHKKALKKEGEMPKDIPLPPPNFPLPGKKPNGIPTSIPNTPPPPEGLPPLPNIKAESPKPAEPPRVEEPPTRTEEVPMPEQPKEEVEVKEELIEEIKIEPVMEEEPKIPESKSVLSDDIGVFDIGEDAEFRDISSSDIKLEPILTAPPVDETQVSEVSDDNIMPSQELDVSAISSSSEKDAILNAVTQALKTISKSALVLFVKEDDMVAVLGFGEHIDGNFDDYKISLSAPNMFQWVFQNKAELSGLPQSGYLNDVFFKRFGGFVPEKIAIVPSVIEGEVVAAIYCEDPSSIDDMKKVAEAMAGSFHRLLDLIW